MANQWHIRLALIVSMFAVVFSFNLDSKGPLVFEGASGEYFGYSVALHEQRNEKKWVVVGAPLGNKTSRYSERDRYGSVYRCNPDTKKCEVIAIDDRDPETDYWNGQFVDIEQMSGQWLGATVISTPSHPNGALMVCAPRYTLWGTVRVRPEDRSRNLLGKCFVVRNDLLGLTKTLQPCYHGDDGDNLNYDRNLDGLCQAGISGATAMNGNSQTFLMGLPGRYFIDGSIAVYFSDSLSSPYMTPSHQAIKDKNKHHDGIAMGYAVAIGKFTSPNREEFVASSTRAALLKGKVMGFRLDGEQLAVAFTLSLPQDIQVGSNFGQSLCAVDLNNDGYSDLLVAAPYQSEDEGRVYVYMNNGKLPGPPLSQVSAMTLEGEKTKRSLFGFAMAVAGDLNKDGYPDVAISAPYGGKDQGGVVYIYFGAKDGIETLPRQAIEASDISAGTKTFGYSLAGNLDVDKNGYPDLAVGAYSSDKAFLLRSRRIVNMEGKITLSPNQISLEDNGTMQVTSDGISRHSINVTVCLKFKNQQPSPLFGSANATYSIELDKGLESEFRRMFFLQGNKASFSMVRQVALSKENEWYCQFKHTVYLRVKENILSVVDPLTFDLVYDLAHSPSCELCPILNDYNDITQRSFTAKADFLKQCGPDKICEPDLSVKGEVKFQSGPEHTELHVGGDDEMTVGVVVENKAQDSAYPGKVIVTYPSIIDYRSSNQGVSCSKVKDNNANSNAKDTKAECIVGNPFGKSKKEFEVRFDTKRVTGNISELVIHLEATSPSKDADPSDNNDTLKVGVKFETDLEISGTSRPDHVVYNDKASEVKAATDIGPSVKSIITVKNNGPSPVEYAEVTILVPFKNKTVEEPKNYLLYLMDLQVLHSSDQEMQGNAGNCNIKTNPLNIQVGNNSNPTDQPPVSSLGKPKRDAQAANEELECDYDSSLTCLKVPCYLGKMKRGGEVQIQMTARLWQNTLIKGKAGSVDLFTTAEVIPSSSVPELKKDNNKYKIQLTANPKTTPTSKKGTPVWVYVVAVLGGLALFALAGLALYKFGFFKRKSLKMEHTEEEATPMRTLEPKGETDPIHV